MSCPVSKDELLDLFYRCQFIKLLECIDVNVASSESEISHEVIHLKASALFELHRMDDVRNTLALTRKDFPSESCEDCLFTIGKLSYFVGNYEEAKGSFCKLLEVASDNRKRFRGLLGIGNIMRSEGHLDKVPALIEEIQDLEGALGDEERISFLLFRGHYCCDSGGNEREVRDYFQSALGDSSRKSWNYFINRALYGLACLEKREKATVSLQCTLDILRSLLEPSQCLYMIYLINEKFKEDELTVDAPIEFDMERLRVKVRGNWIPYHDKALLFKFLRSLHLNGKFASKETLVQSLWPKETYNPPIHDPRIYDIARRTRRTIEAYEDQPIILLSGRDGYKLASCRDDRVEKPHR